MKRFWSIILGVLLATTLYSCQEDPEAATPEIQLGQTEVTIASDGSAVSIAYQIVNPIEGEKISISESADWLAVNTSKPRAIEFLAAVNESTEERKAEVTVGYKGAQSLTITVTQSCFDLPLKIEIKDISATEILFSVFTTEPDLTWLPMITSKAYFDGIESDEALFIEDMEYINYLAEINDLTVEQYLESVLAVGSIEDIFFDNLTPSTDYVLYAYGITPSGKRTSAIITAPFTTDESWNGDITFNFEVEEEDHVLYYKIFPSHTGVPYYYGITTEETLNMWKAEYGDNLKDAIQQGDIEYYIEMFREYEFIEERSEYYAMYNEIGNIRDGYQKCKASTKYIFYAAKWNEECKIVGEISTFEYTSEPVEPSDNQISLSVSNVTQSTADVHVTTTNNDPYVVINVESSAIAGMNDQEVFNYIYNAYDSYLPEFTFSGDKTRTFSRMNPNTEYTFVAFGYDAKTMTTSTVTKATFKTESSHDPQDCVFNFEVSNIDTETAWVNVTPSDNGLHYYWAAFLKDVDAQGVKDYVNMIIEEWYEGDVAAFSSWVLAQGPASEEIWGMIPDTEYRIAAVVMDYNSGEFLADVQFSNVFRTEAITYANIGVKVDFGPYYDIQELVDAGHSEYKGLLRDGDAILPARIQLTGEHAAYYYNVYGRDLTDVETYPDHIFQESLQEDGSTYPETNFAIAYDYPLTMVAMAIDRNGNYSHIFRKTFTITAEGASPIDEFLASLNVAPQKSSAIEWTNFNADRQLTEIAASRKEAEKCHLNDPEVEAKAAKAMASIEQERRENLRKNIESRRQSRNFKMIAR